MRYHLLRTLSMITMPPPDLILVLLNVSRLEAVLSHSPLLKEVRLQLPCRCHQAIAASCRSISPDLTARDVAAELRRLWLEQLCDGAAHQAHRVTVEEPGVVLDGVMLLDAEWTYVAIRVVVDLWHPSR